MSAGMAGLVYHLLALAYVVWVVAAVWAAAGGKLRTVLCAYRRELRPAVLPLIAVSHLVGAVWMRDLLDPQICVATLVGGVVWVVNRDDDRERNDSAPRVW